MATVTGMTAAAMLAIRNGMVVGATFDSANHLILTKYDGTQIDAGTIAAATTGASGLVELATNAETLAGTDTVRAVTPASLASIPGNKVQTLTADSIGETAASTSYPTGVSVMSLTGAGTPWSVNSGFGFVVTNKSETDRASQTFYSNAGGTGVPRSWVRTYHSTNGGGGWTAWAQTSLIVNLTAASFTQTTAFTSYPTGQSRLYYTTANSSAWDFTGKAGEVLTFSDGVDFARQTWTKHASGSAVPETWFRTANAASGWTAWRIIARDYKLPDPQVVSFNGLNTITATTWAVLPTGPLTLTTNYPYDCIVQIDLSSWLTANYTDSTTVRAGISVDGGDPTVYSGGTWGQVLYESSQGTQPGSGQHSTSIITKLAAGSRTIQAHAYKTGSATTSVNYPVLRVTPLRWAE